MRDDEIRLAVDEQVIVLAPSIDAQEPQPFDDGIEAVGFFLRELAHLAEYRSSVRMRSYQSEHRDLIDHARDMLLGYLAASQPGGIGSFDDAIRFPALLPHVAHFDGSTHALERTDETDTAGIEAHILYLDRAASLQERRADKERCRRRISRHIDL